ncbi:MAG: glycosyltransferase family 4 protein [Verrucomicrobia bacterium]|nr:glycosyltransferase family 4 protein [Verrucomicrobiota bacterium]
MKILSLVTDAFGGHGGIAKFNRDLLTALCAAPDVQGVTALPRLLPSPVGELPAKLDFDTRGVGGKLRYALAVLKAAIRNRKSEIILCGHINLLPLAFLARLVCRAPVVLVIHGVDAWQPTRSGLVNRLARRVDAVIAVSEFTKQKFLAWAQPVRARGFVLPNCVDLARFTPGPKSPTLLARYGLQGKTVLLTVARLSAVERYKGHDQILELLPALAAQIPNASYLVVGDGDDRERLERKAIELGVRERVVFAGKIAEAEKVEHYRLADVFVMPGRGEGFGIVYLEALACGVPVVASKVDASAEVARGCELAVTVAPDDLREIREGILAMLKAPHGVAPERARYFSDRNFNQRCLEILDQLRRGDRN